MAQKDIQVCFNVHFDSVSLWLGSFGGEDSPCDISRGVHAATCVVSLRSLLPCRTMFKRLSQKVRCLDIGYVKSRFRRLQQHFFVP